MFYCWNQKLYLKSPSECFLKGSLIYKYWTYPLIKIQQIHPSSFQELTHLRQLFLNNNALQALDPYTQNTLAHLEILTLHANWLSYLHEDLFQGLSNLSLLWLGDNFIRNLDPGVFRELHQLKYLALYDNYLASLPARLFQDINSLVRLWLHNNLIMSEAMKPGVFQNLSQLKNTHSE